MHAALQLPALISCSARRHGTENGVSLMGGLPRAEIHACCSSRHSALSSKGNGTVKNQSTKRLTLTEVNITVTRYTVREEEDKINVGL